MKIKLFIDIAEDGFVNFGGFKTEFTQNVYSPNFGTQRYSFNVDIPHKLDVKEVIAGPVEKVLEEAKP